MAAPLTVHSLPALKDNYIHVVVDSAEQTALVIDPSQAPPVQQFLLSHHLSLSAILLTHHHHDHVGGVTDLVRLHPDPIPVICSAWDRPRIAGASLALADGDVWTWQGHHAHALETPGHTHGALTYFWPSDGLVFTGDTVFTWGCGRLFEGTADQMHQSLQKIRALPPSTLMYCGHEYGRQNLAFCLWVAGQAEFFDLYQPQELAQLRHHWREMTAQPQKRSVPSPLDTETHLNPFLKARSPTEFQRLRQLKDDFRLEDYSPVG